MKTQRVAVRFGSFFRGVVLLGLLAGTGAPWEVARGGDRQFLVILANSPKQYPGPRANNDLLGKPPGGLANKQLVQDQYFDTQRADIGSFAEYWKEISYGDVTVHGFVTDWINLPWAIQPPLLDPNRDTATGGPPSEDLNLDDRTLRNSPFNFFDLNTDGAYEYGAGERINNFLAALPLDLDGDPGNVDDGPFTPGLGSINRTLTNQLVWKPGERFVDMDNDKRWDGLDEARNSMDFDLDSRPDLAGPWYDLNGDNQGTAQVGCVYLADSDNDGNPDCCPQGIGADSCNRKCPSTHWAGRRGDIIDCNGNLIPDPCDVSCTSTECLATGWTGSCGKSKDELPYAAQGTACSVTKDGIPDECQFNHPEAKCVSEPSPDGPCNAIQTKCVSIRITPAPRCEFADSNANTKMDIPEPFENFMRRWDPCLTDPDASFFQINTVREHWVKVYDPLSISNIIFPPLECASDGRLVSNKTTCAGGVNVQKSCTKDADCPGSYCRDRAVRYSDPSYIVNNYPGQAMECAQTHVPCTQDSQCLNDVSDSCDFLWNGPKGICRLDSLRTCTSNADCRTCRSGVELLVSEGHGHFIYGRHDPFGQIAAPRPGESCTCRCSFPNPDPNVDPSNLFCCFEYTFPDGTQVPDACVAGFSVMYDPSDYWFNTNVTTGPGNTPQTTTKMQTVSEITDLGFLRQFTPKPGTVDVFFDHADAPWFEQAWSDRYNANGQDQCQNPAFILDRTQPERTPCKVPDWPGYGVHENEFSPLRNVRRVVQFTDTDAATYNVLANRRYFHANAGGLNGDGTGWVGCNQAFDSGVEFESGPVTPNGFETICNHAILPEESGGPSLPGQFYDGWVEHDDLSSSKYHKAGDQRLGEVTSPFSPNIWGEDRGPGSASVPPALDLIVPAAGPYAVSVHGNNGRDAGNQLAIEYLTWRTEPPFNNGFSWILDDFLPNQFYRNHPYASPFSGADLGFRDYNLDGLIDQGEVRYAGSENYQSDSFDGTINNGVYGYYPFNRDRLMEDAINVLDDTVDFDDFVDPVSMNAVTCGGGAPIFPLFPDAWSQSCTQDSDCNDGRDSTEEFCDTGSGTSGSGTCIRFGKAKGVCSGILMMPAQAFRGGDFNLSPAFLPIHNEDNDSGPYSFPATQFAPTGVDGRNFKPQLTWNIFFHDLVASFSVAGEGKGPVTVPTRNFQTAFAAHEYLHAWQHFPDLYDYDVYAPPPQPPINCPVASWDIMSGGGLVHPAPILKESTCTQWLKSVDLATVLTPGVDATITLPRYEFVRDDSVYYLENENRLREKYWFWSVGSGFDKFQPGTSIFGMPGDGMLIMHTDRDSSNPDALPNGQTNGTRFFYYIVQADGLDHLDDCTDFGEPGDAWPGSANKTKFNFDTIPSATWYTQNSWTGLDIENVVSDGNGSVQIQINWIPTSLPSLKFTDPPGGVSVPVSPGLVRYSARFRASDVFGGTTIRLYYTTDPTNVTIGAGNFIGEKHKTTPGTNDLSVDWNIFGLADGRYYLFAELIPGPGADGTESSSTRPRGRRNNVGTGGFGTCSDNAALGCNEDSDCRLTPSSTATCNVVPVTVHIAEHKARLETWTAECVKADGTEFRVTSSLTQPPPLPTDANQDPYAHAIVGQPYTDRNGAVNFTIRAGAKPFGTGDSFSFTTTGITAVSQGVTIDGGAIKEDPTARISATPLSGDPPLTVKFDARDSTDPNGEPLSYRWNFGDGSAVDITPAPTHVFSNFGRYTVVLRATNVNSGRFGEAALDIDVTNNPPHAVLGASPLSGPAPLTVQFTAAQSSDVETSANDLIYQWDFGDGTTANDAGDPGTLVSTAHFYSHKTDGTTCTHAAPCVFTATLTVTDEGGKKDTATATINVGNTNPTVNITASPLQGSFPLEVHFNGFACADADGDPIKIDWDFGDGNMALNVPRSGDAGQTDGTVKHTYSAAGTFKAKAKVKDDHGGQVDWVGATITVTQPSGGGGGGGGGGGSSEPVAVFTITPAQPKINQEFTVDANQSFDNPSGGPVSSYSWDWGDHTALGSGATSKHTYVAAGAYTITLTVADNASPANTGRTQHTVTISAGSGGGGETPGNNPPVAAFTVLPGLQGGIGDAFTFDASASSDPDGDTIRFSWNFGDGTSTNFSTDGTAVHTYDAAGSYAVRLAVRDEHNATTNLSKTIHIVATTENQTPVAIIASGPRIVTQGDAVVFDGSLSFDPDADPITFTWTFHFGDTLDEVLTGAQVTKVFSNLGTYTVDLAVSDNHGAIGNADTVTITVDQRVIVEPPPPDKPPVQPEDPPDSNGQRPSGQGTCGVGMLPALFASLAGLQLLRRNRRRMG